MEWRDIAGWNRDSSPDPDEEDGKIYANRTADGIRSGMGDAVLGAAGQISHGADGDISALGEFSHGHSLSRTGAAHQAYEEVTLRQ